MTANDIADMVEKEPYHTNLNRTTIAYFIRQQQAEIEALKQIIDTNNLNQNIGQFVKPANEPVAWMVAEMVFDTEETAIAIGKTYDDEVIPLYTHPVKELTDEEIIACTGCLPKYNSEIVDEDLVKFARAILRKAQENG